MAAEQLTEKAKQKRIALQMHTISRQAQTNSSRLKHIIDLDYPDVPDESNKWKPYENKWVKLKQLNSNIDDFSAIMLIIDVSLSTLTFKKFTNGKLATNTVALVFLKDFTIEVETITKEEAYLTEGMK
jgi:hypothetical protein